MKEVVIVKEVIHILWRFACGDVFTFRWDSWNPLNLGWDRQSGNSVYPVHLSSIRKCPPGNSPVTTLQCIVSVDSLDQSHIPRRPCCYNVSNIAGNMLGFGDLTDNGSDGGGLWLKLGEKIRFLKDIYDSNVCGSFSMSSPLRKTASQIILTLLWHTTTYIPNHCKNCECCTVLLLIVWVCLEIWYFVL